jgi:hypothetical protein
MSFKNLTKYFASSKMSKNIFVMIFSVGMVFGVLTSFATTAHANFFSDLLSRISGGFATVFLAGGAPETNYQGKLTESSGIAVPNDTYNIRFKLYTTATGGTPIWSENHCYSSDGGNTCDGSGTDSKVPVTSGLFSTMLGSVNSLSGVDFNQVLYLGVEIGGTSTAPTSGDWDGEMSPRKRVGSVPSAFTAGNLNGVSDTQFIRTDTANATTSTGSVLTLTQNGSGSIMDLYSGATKVFNMASSGTAYFTGNVGIGTVSPAGFKLNVDGTVNMSAAGNRHEISNSAGNNEVVRFVNSDATNPYGNSIFFSAAAPNDASHYFETFSDTGGAKYTVYSNGSIVSAAGATFNGNVSVPTISGLQALTVLKDQNGQTTINVSNTTAGSGAASGYNLGNDLNGSARGQILQTSSATSFGGAYLPDQLVLSENGGTGGILLDSTANYPIYFAVNNTEVGQFTSTGLNNTAIGSTTPSTGAFTTLTSTGNAYLAITSGNVGIGTTNPNQGTLQIGPLSNTTTRYTQVFGAYDSTTGYPQILFNNAGSHYMGQGVSTAGDLVFGSVSGVNPPYNWLSQQMVIQQSTGNVGIGTTTPATALSVVGTTTVQNINITNGIYKNGVPLIGSQWTTNGSDIYYNTGKVGIGMTSPSGQLDVAVPAWTNWDNSSQNVVIGSGSSGDGVRIGYNDSSVTGVINVLKPGRSWGNLSLAYGGGNVGIGTFSPQQKLDVSGNALVSGYESIGTTAIGARLNVASTNEVGVSVTDTTAKGTLVLDGPTGSTITYKTGGVNKWEAGTASSNDYLIYDYTGTRPALRVVGNGDMSLMESGGNVGIGMTAPAVKLDVNGNIRTEAGTIDSATYLALNSGSGQPVVFSVNGGTEAMRILSNGNVGIGTASPGAKLEVNTAVVNDGSNAALMLTTGSYGSGSASPQVVFNHNGSYSYIGQNGGNQLVTGVNSDALTLRSSDAIEFATAGNNRRMIIDTSGNVGIGTVSPGAKLDVSGNINISSGSHYKINGTNLSYSDVGAQPAGTYLTAESDTLASVTGRGATTSAESTFSGGLVLAKIRPATDSTTAFQINKANGTTNVLNVDTTNGNVGIGTTSPVKRLDVLSSGAGDSIRLLPSTGSAYGRLTQDSDNAIALYLANTSGGLGVYLSPNSANSSYINAGNVGIGTTTPATALSVVGTTTVQNLNFTGGLFQNGSPYVGSQWTSTSTGVYYNGGSVGIGTTAPGYMLDVYSATDPYAIRAVGAGNKYIKAESSDDNVPEFILSGNGNAWYLAKNRDSSGGGLTIAYNGGSKLDILTNGNVGIGTTAPSQTLTVNGTASVATSLFVGGSSALSGTKLTVNGDGAAVGIKALTSGYSSYLDFRNSDESTRGLFGVDGTGFTGTAGQFTIGTWTNSPMTFYTDAAQRMIIAANGNVGINSTVPAALAVSGGTGSQMLINYNGTGDNYFDATNDTHFRSTTSYTDRLTILSNGNVGLGEASPADKLDVTTSGGTTVATFKNTTTDANTFWSASSGASTKLIFGQGGSNYARIVMDGSDSNKLKFTDGGQNPWMTIDQSGRVGIGSTTPSTTFVVAGTSTLQNVIPAGPYTGNMSTYSLGASTTRWSSLWAQYVNVGTSTWSLAQVPGSNRFGIFSSPNGGGTEALSILPNGNVGIGTTSPVSNFSIAGTTTIQNMNVTGNLLKGGTPFVGSQWTTSGSNIYYNSGNIGIGTASPGTKLDIAGNTAINDNKIWFRTANDDNHYLKFEDLGTGHDSNGLHIHEYGGFRFSTDSISSALEILRNGNVGIGTTNPGTKLDIASSNTVGVRITDDTAKGTLVLDGPTGSTITYKVGGTNMWEVGTVSSSNDYVVYDYTGTKTMLRAEKNGDLALMEGAGNVGVGTTAPGAKLQVGAYFTNLNGRLLTSNGSGWASDGATPLMVVSGNTSNTNKGALIGLDLHNDNTTDGTYSPIIAFSRRSSNSSYNSTYAAISGQSIGVGNDANWVSGDLVFSTAPSGGYMTESMRIKGSGNILIGSDTEDGSTAKLQVTGGANFHIPTQTGNNINPVVISNTDISGYLSGWYTGDATLILGGRADGSGISSFAMVSPDGSGGWVNSSFEINNNGNLGHGNGLGMVMGGIGSTAAGGYYLTYWGTNGYFGVNHTVIDDSTGKMFVNASADDGSGAMFQVTGTGNVARFNGDSGSYCTIDPSTGSMYCTSDKNLKKNIRSFGTSTDTSTLANVLKLNPVTYNWKTDGSTSTKKYGFIAQEVEQIFPSLVNTDSKSGTKSLSMNGFIPFIVEAIQQLNAKVDKIALRIVNGVSHFKQAIIGEVQTNKLCVGQTCITENELKTLLARDSLASASSSAWMQTASAAGTLSALSATSTATTTSNSPAGQATVQGNSNAGTNAPSTIVSASTTSTSSDSSVIASSTTQSSSTSDSLAGQALVQGNDNAGTTTTSTTSTEVATTTEVINADQASSTTSTSTTDIGTTSESVSTTSTEVVTTTEVVNTNEASSTVSASTTDVGTTNEATTTITTEGVPTTSAEVATTTNIDNASTSNPASVALADLKNSLPLFVFLGLIILVSIGIIIWPRVSSKTKRPAKKGVVAQNEYQIPSVEIKSVINGISKHIVLPKDEEPTITKIENVASFIKNQPFCQGAEKGDVLVAYKKAAKVIIYSISKDMIINVGALHMQSEKQANIVNSDTVDSVEKK